MGINIVICNFGLKVSKESDVYSIRLSSYCKPNTTEVRSFSWIRHLQNVHLQATSQTEQYFLKKRSEADLENFDYFDHVKNSFKVSLCQTLTT